MALIPFDDRDGTIWLNGEMLPWRNAVTHVMEYTMLFWNSRDASTGNGTAAFEAVSLSDHT